VCSKKVTIAAKKYCNAIFSAGDLFVGNDFTWINQAIDINEFKPNIVNEIPEKYLIDKKDEEFVIYHSFGNSAIRPDVKGSGYIKNAVSELQKNGYKIKYLFVDNIPNRDIKYIQCQADLVIEQVCAGWYGITAVECLSLGKPVISYLRDDALSICPNKNIPIINTNPATLKTTLENLINNQDAIKEIGIKSRKYAEKYHDRKVVAANLLEYYKRDYL
jgi:hypothetical protein